VVPRRLSTSLALAVFAGAAFAGSGAPAARVVGGSVIQVQQAPWTVFVQQQAGSSRFLCTGSIVDAVHILTAAHCVYDDQGVLATPANLSVKAGVSNFSAPLATDLEQDRAVSQFRVHPAYVWSGKPVPDDVAVLALVTPLDLSGPAVQAVALPTPGSPFPAGAAVALAGFGRQAPTVSTSGPLSWMTATADAQGICSSSGGGYLSNNAILLCAASPSSAVCNGDSGSGLISTNGPPTLIGVASAGSTGCEPGSHGIFTYTGAPEILRFIQGENTPPSAPRETADTFLELDWDPPLVAGNKLSCSSGGWPAPSHTAFSFVATGDGKVLQAGPSSTFQIPPADVGMTVRCEVAVSNDGGTTVAETEATAAIKPPPQLRIGRIAPVRATPGGLVQLTISLNAPAGLYGKYGVCASLPSKVGGRICKSVAGEDGSSGVFPFVLKFKIRPTSPLVTTKIAITGIAGLSTAKTTALLHIARS
jgi:hypothetical protein